MLLAKYYYYYYYYLRQSHQGTRDGQGMHAIWYRSEMYISIWPRAIKGKDHMEELGIDGK